MKVPNIPIVATLYFAAALAYESPVAVPHSKAVAQSGARFQSLDRDHDQRISKAEAAANHTVAERFAGVDANADGFISKAEFDARPSAEPFE